MFALGLQSINVSRPILLLMVSLCILSVSFSKFPSFYNRQKSRHVDAHNVMREPMSHSNPYAMGISCEKCKSGKATKCKRAIRMLPVFFLVGAVRICPGGKVLS